MKRSVLPPRSRRSPSATARIAFRVEPEVVDEHRLGQLRREDLDPGIAAEDPGDAARVVLLGVIGDEIVDLRDVLQIGLEDGELGRLDGVDEGGLVAASDEIGVIARAVGQRDEGVEEPAVEIGGADVEDVGDDLSGFHDGGTPRDG